MKGSQRAGFVPAHLAHFTCECHRLCRCLPAWQCSYWSRDFHQANSKRIKCSHAVGRLRLLDWHRNFHFLENLHLRTHNYRWRRPPIFRATAAQGVPRAITSFYKVCNLVTSGNFLLLWDFFFHRRLCISIRCGEDEGNDRLFATLRKLGWGGASLNLISFSLRPRVPLKSLSLLENFMHAYNVLWAAPPRLPLRVLPSIPPHHVVSLPTSCAVFLDPLSPLRAPAGHR